MRWLYFAFIQIVLIEFGGVSADIETHYLISELCNETMFMDNYKSTHVHTFLLKLSAENDYPHNLHCFFTAEVQKDSEQIMFYFKTFSVRGDQCQYDWLELHDGDSLASPYVCGADGRLCGLFPSKLKSVFITETNYLTLYFASGLQEHYHGFEIVITRFRYAPCRSDEFECENGRCIDKSIECNGYNPCGDNSACRRLSVGDKFAIVLGVIVAIIVTVGVILCVRRCKSNKKRTGGDETTSLCPNNSRATSNRIQD